MALHYQWYMDGAPVGEDSPILEGSSPIQKVAQIYCDVSNEAGTTRSNIVQLVVNAGTFTLSVYHLGELKNLQPDQVQYPNTEFEAGQEVTKNGQEKANKTAKSIREQITGKLASWFSISGKGRSDSDTNK